MLLKSTFKKSVRSLLVFFPSFVDLKAEVRYQLQHKLRIPHESDFKALAHFHPGPDEVFIDVGANRGQSIESILLTQPRANIVSFEPNMVLWPFLKKRYSRASNIRLHPVGLSDAATSVDLFVPVYRGFVFDALASVEEASAYSWLSKRTLYGFSAQHLEVEKYTIQLVRLDSMQLQPAFIKIDVEGTEISVIRGGLETIKKHLPVLLIESVKPGDPISILLKKLGYHCYAFHEGKLYKNEGGTGNSFLINPLASRFDPEVFAHRP